jgi:hypothetical protein
MVQMGEVARKYAQEGGATTPMLMLTICPLMLKICPLMLTI